MPAELRMTDAEIKAIEDEWKAVSCMSLPLWQIENLKPIAALLRKIPALLADRKVLLAEIKRLQSFLTAFPNVGKR